MSRWPPVRAIRLHGAKIRSGSDRRVSIFPLFSPDGAVHSIMVTDTTAGTISLTPIEEACVRVPIAGRSEILGLRPVDDEGVAALSGLWHYDPWWVLARPPLSGHWAAPLMKETNCVNFLTGVNSIWFARDLSSVAWVEVQEADRLIGRRRATGGVTRTRWSPAILSSSAGLVRQQRADRVADHGPGWVLDPIWSKATQRRHR